LTTALLTIELMTSPNFAVLFRRNRAARQRAALNQNVNSIGGSGRAPAVKYIN
jgi:hypothetical protein